MTKNNLERPKFVELFFEQAARGYKSRGLIAVVPVWIIAFIIAATVIVDQIPNEFWKDSAKNIPSYAGILTLNGLLLTLAWNAFAKVFENICAPKFSSYLQRNGVLQVYMFQVNYVQAAQLVAVLTSGCGLIVLLIDNVLLLANRFMLVATLATSAYAIKEAVSIVSVLHDLIWYRSIFEADQEKSAENVARFPSGGR